jgi:probable rRNA maturation factor
VRLLNITILEMPSISPRIQFNNADVDLALKQKRKLKQFIQFIFKNEHRAATHVNYVFCSDEYLLKINQDFLSHDDYTDIITFNLAEADEPVIGEIYISIDRVQENAERFAVPTYNELLRVMFHGVLHLCGYQDKSSRQKQLMKQMEDFYLAKFFL